MQATHLLVLLALQLQGLAALLQQLLLLLQVLPPPAQLLLLRPQLLLKALQLLLCVSGPGVQSLRGVGGRLQVCERAPPHLFLSPFTDSSSPPTPWGC